MKSNITAVVPVYNGKRYLREAVESIIGQTLRPERLIIIDDGSSDGSTDVLKGLEAQIPITIIRQDNSGQAASRNKGIALAETEFVALLDQDDIWYPKHCEMLIQPLLSSPKVGWTYSNLDKADAEGQVMLARMLDAQPITHPKRDFQTCLSEDMFILPSASLLRKTAVMEVGGFDEKLIGYEDDDLFLRLLVAGWGNEYLPESLSFWRIHDRNTIWSQHMITSRAYYFTKLSSAFPNRPDVGEYLVRDCLTPRFYSLSLNDYKIAICFRNFDVCRQMRADMKKYARLAEYGIGAQLTILLLTYPSLIWLFYKTKRVAKFCLRPLISRLSKNA